MFLVGLEDKVQSSYDPSSIFLVGVFIMGLSNAYDVFAGNHHSTEIVENYNNFAHRLYLHDALRVTNGPLKHYTCCQTSVLGMGEHLHLVLKC